MRADVAADEHEHDVVADGELSFVEPDADVEDPGQRLRARDRGGELFPIGVIVSAPAGTQRLLVRQSGAARRGGADIGLRVVCLPVLPSYHPLF